jgi:hypothetical protein
MGDISEMILDGILCEGCGDLVDGAPTGHPRKCVSCRPINLADALAGRYSRAAARKAARHNRERHAAAKLRKPFECHCGKLCRTAGGLSDHQRAKHGGV